MGGGGGDGWGEGRMGGGGGMGGGDGVGGGSGGGEWVWGVGGGWIYIYICVRILCIYIYLCVCVCIYIYIYIYIYHILYSPLYLASGVYRSVASRGTESARFGCAEWLARPKCVYLLRYVEFVIVSFFSWSNAGSVEPFSHVFTFSSSWRLPRGFSAPSSSSDFLF